MELAGRASRSVPREQGMGVRPRGEWRSDSPHQSFSMGHIFCPVQAAFAGIAAGERCPACRPDAFCAASGLKRVDPRLHSSSLQHSLPSPTALGSTSFKITETYHDPYPSFSMDTGLHWSNLHWSEFDSYSRYLGLTFDSEPSVFPSTFYKSQNLLTHEKIHQSINQPPQFVSANN